MMSLIKRLREVGDDLAGFDGSGGLYHEAADRIAELERRWNDILEVEKQAKSLRDAAWGKALEQK